MENIIFHRKDYFPGLVGMTLRKKGGIPAYIRGVFDRFVLLGSFAAIFFVIARKEFYGFPPGYAQKNSVGILREQALPPLQEFNSRVSIFQPPKKEMKNFAL